MVIFFEIENGRIQNILMVTGIFEIRRISERSSMYYYDEFGKEFKDELSFHEYLEEIDERAKWIRIPSRSLSVLTVSGHEVLVPDMEGVNMKDLLADTKKHSGLLLQFPEGMYPLGKTAVSTLKDRARIKGTALMDVKKSVLADILNECLQVAKGDALLRISRR